MFQVLKTFSLNIVLASSATIFCVLPTSSVKADMAYTSQTDAATHTVVSKIGQAVEASQANKSEDSVTALVKTSLILAFGVGAIKLLRDYTSS